MIYLLDLNYTLVSNSTTIRKPFSRQIEIETYRVELLQALLPFRVILMTARPEKYRQETLDSISKKTGFGFGEAYFNKYGMTPPKAKRLMLIEEVFPKHGPDPKQYHGIESNPLTRSMYRAFGIRSENYESFLRSLQ